MQTKIIPTSSSNALPIALKLLRAGELVAFPTDTVYGVGTLAFNAAGAEKIYQAKKRPPDKALPILLADIEDFEKVAINVPEMARKLAEKFLPGALTIILPKHPDIPDVISSLDTVGIRIPDHDFTRTLLRAAGPMAVTSANISGKNSPISAEEVYAQLKGRLPLILDGGIALGGIPSTVVDCTGNKMKVLREGEISEKRILRILLGII
ncbi:MAG: threonylcarbamoyl-AMP synthase [Anaerolineae bacterium]|nr:threonylcarbamoyl-AMP synthase [Anaerolineae bacterium]MBT4309642.1 threonylcarbamoyl-AMP synthase [Anaerolineae bacterium]MBT4458313.1 threonylcarbamoyl-AMP synthase [Anaerolineae bacterium]MBT4842725.1 threonylcarbamoyl-AMP synthase [Anaerolineae bacterium]MBT6322693.1 threonylcarbamoyl-AMP synthase [Anaerolineae bacterium]